MTIPRLDQKLFNEGSYGNSEEFHELEWFGFGNDTYLDKEWFDQHAIGYGVDDEERELIFVMFDFNGELCWLKYTRSELKTIDVKLS